MRGRMETVMSDCLNDVLRDTRAALALRLAGQAGQMLVHAFWRGSTVDSKRNAAKGLADDPVSAADRAAERLMRENIAEAFPDDGILGEEFGASPQAGSGHVWVLDPIDGTRSFICGLPGWTVLIALLREEMPVLGLVHEPLSGMTIIGNGSRCWRLLHGRVEDAEQVRVRKTVRLEQAFCGTTLPRLYDTPGRSALLQALQQRARHVQFDADALFYAALAQGRLDVALDTRLALHDAAALVPIVRGAGGIISDWCGRQAALPGSDIIACATPALHEQMLALLEETGAAAESQADATCTPSADDQGPGSNGGQD